MFLGLYTDIDIIYQYITYYDPKLLFIWILVHGFIYKEIYGQNLR